MDAVHIQTDKLSNGKYKMYGIAGRHQDSAFPIPLNAVADN